MREQDKHHTPNVNAKHVITVKVGSDIKDIIDITADKLSVSKSEVVRTAILSTYGGSTSE